MSQSALGLSQPAIDLLLPVLLCPAHSLFSSLQHLLSHLGLPRQAAPSGWNILYPLFLFS